jgi:hypothetical protein
MPILDDRGRLFGKVNLIDAAVVVFLLVLVPLGYGAWRLFKAPPSVFTGVTPTLFKPGVLNQAVVVSGQRLRPFYRVFVGNDQADYLFGTTERAELRLPALEPGTYDVVFFDDAMEIGRLPNAIAVGVKPVVKPVVRSLLIRPAGRPGDPVQLELQGKNLDGPSLAYFGAHRAAHQVSTADKMEVHPPDLTAGVYDFILYGERIAKAGAAPQDNAADAEGTEGREVLAQQPKAVTVAELDVVFRAVTRPEIAEAVTRALAADTRQQPTTATAVVVSCTVTDEVTGAGYIERKDGRMNVLKIVLRVAAVKTPQGWQHDGWMMRPGQAFRLDTPNYVFDGDILSVAVARARQ